MPKLTAGTGYMPGLDVLRGLAITMVLVFHGFSSRRDLFASFGSPILVGVWQLTWWSLFGVHLFFVLSGFLITGILIDSRKKEDYYRGFYLRRVLRIVPAYIFTLAVLKLTGWISWRYVAVAMAYLANICSLFHVLPMYGPLWSLSVEEQFYMTWPFVVRKLTNRRLLWLSVALIVLTPVLRFCLRLGPPFISDFGHKTWGVGDFFAAGAIVAIARRTQRLKAWVGKLAYPVFLTGAVLIVIQSRIPDATGRLTKFMQNAVSFEPFLLLCVGSLMIALSHPEIAGVRLLKPMVFLADISYGLYLYHMFFFDKIESRWTIPEGTPGAMLGWVTFRFSVEVLISVAFAWVSRQTLEEFFLRLKPKRHLFALPAHA